MSATTDKIHAWVARLLRDAEHAQYGAQMAWSFGAAHSAQRLDARAKALREAAELIDPRRTADAWDEATPTKEPEA